MSLESVIQRIAASSSLQASNETATRQAAVLPVLSGLGWDTLDLDEVIPEYRVEGGFVDYALRVDGKLVLIEVKRAGTELDPHEEQLLNYAFRDGAELATLTDGITWHFYLPTATGSWRQRRFFTVDFEDQELERAAGGIAGLLGREAVQTGAAVEAARELLDESRREALVREALPRVWLQLATEPDEGLVDLVAEAVESHSGRRPTNQEVAEYLSSIVGGPTTSQPSPVPIAPPLTPVPSIPSMAKPSSAGGGFTHTTIRGFWIDDEYDQVPSYTRLLLAVSAEAYKRNAEAFERQVVGMRGKKRVYFSRDQNEIFEPGLIPNTDIYADTNFSANEIVKRCRRILEAVGLDPQSLRVDVVAA